MVTVVWPWRQESLPPRVVGAVVKETQGDAESQCEVVEGVT